MTCHDPMQYFWASTHERRWDGSKDDSCLGHVRSRNSGRSRSNGPYHVCGRPTRRSWTWCDWCWGRTARGPGCGTSRSEAKERGLAVLDGASSRRSRDAFRQFGGRDGGMFG